jgi:putative NADH-flavin reductase
MKVTIFGAAGRTGRHLVRQALDKGYEVVAFAHHPSKLGITDERLETVQGDVREADKVAAAIAGADAVISVLGPSSNQEAYAISRGMEEIIAAMEQHAVQRLIVSVGAGVGDPKDQPGVMDKAITFILKLTARNVYEDMKRVAEIVRASDRRWTLVRAPMLTDDPGTGDVRAGYLGKDVGSRLSREDLAAFMLEQVESDAYLHEAPVISN